MQVVYKLAVKLLSFKVPFSLHFFYFIFVHNCSDCLWIVILFSIGSEEADFVWEAESDEWQQEKQACVALVERMLDAFASVYADRMRMAIELQMKQLKQVQDSWNKLNIEMNLLSKKPPVNALLKFDLKKLMQMDAEEGKDAREKHSNNWSEMRTENWFVYFKTDFVFSYE